MENDEIIKKEDADTIRLRNDLEEALMSMPGAERIRGSALIWWMLWIDLMNPNGSERFIRIEECARKYSTFCSVPFKRDESGGLFQYLIVEDLMTGKKKVVHLHRK